jgi:hypothetical protein
MEMINIWGDGTVNYTDLIIVYHAHVWIILYPINMHTQICQLKIKQKLKMLSKL